MVLWACLALIAAMQWANKKEFYILKIDQAEAGVKQVLDLPRVAFYIFIRLSR